MGSGEVGGGGSVKWLVKFDDGTTKFDSRDQVDKPPEEVGKSKGHGGFFKVLLTFDNRQDRDNAYDTIAKLDENMITMFVKAYRNKPDQIRIDW